MRTCELCGAEYAASDTIQRCAAIAGGARCGGDVLPTFEEPEGGCLVCRGSGNVGIVTPDGLETWPCPRGCEPKSVLVPKAQL